LDEAAVAIFFAPSTGQTALLIHPWHMATPEDSIVHSFQMEQHLRTSGFVWSRSDYIFIQSRFAHDNFGLASHASPLLRLSLKSTPSNWSLRSRIVQGIGRTQMSWFPFGKVAESNIWFRMRERNVLFETAIVLP